MINSLITLITLFFNAITRFVSAADKVGMATEELVDEWHKDIQRNAKARTLEQELRFQKRLAKYNKVVNNTETTKEDKIPY